VSPSFPRTHTLPLTFLNSYTWDGVIHKVNIPNLQYYTSIRYLENTLEMLDLNMKEQLEEYHADRDVGNR